MWITRGFFGTVVQNPNFILLAGYKTDLPFRADASGD
jgi:hypothetical protein